MNRKFAVWSAWGAIGFLFLFYMLPDTPPDLRSTQPTTRPAPLPPSLQLTLKDYEQYIRESLHKTGTPGAAIAIISDSSIIYLKGFGVKNIHTGNPVDTETVFRLASVSKPIASTLTAILVEDSLFSWNDPVTRHLHQFQLKSPEHTQQLTLKHLLSHSTGLPYHTYTNLIEEGYDMNAMITELKAVDLVGTPGEMYSYQNVAFSVIGDVISAASGKSFETMMKERLFGPLRMTHASLSYEDILSNSNVAQPHLYRNHKWNRIPISTTYYNVAPAGGINASITDMAKWMVALIGERKDIISDSSLRTIYKPEIKATAKNRNFNKWSRIKKSFYGLGWRVIHFQEDTLVYHGGYVNGYRSEVAIHPSRKIGICVLANGASNFSDDAIPEFLIRYDKYHKPQTVKLQEAKTP
jgi:beta-lactamase class C